MSDSDDSLQSDDYEYVIRSLKSRLRSTRECLELMRNEYSSSKEEISDLQKEKEKLADLVFEIKNENVLFKKEIANLKLELKGLINENEMLKNELEMEKSLKNIKNNNDEDCGEVHLKDELDQVKRKNYFLQLENDKAVAYVSEYVSKLKEFEENLIKERKRFYDLLSNANKEILELKNELEAKSSTSHDLMDKEKFMKENQDLNTKCVNLRINLSRTINEKKELNLKMNNLTNELKEKEIEIKNLKQKNQEFEGKLSEPMVSSTTKEVSD